MFRGANAITMDDKGRITIPTRYRELLQEECSGQIVCTKDVSQPCLLMYPLHEWEQIEKKLRNLSDTNPAERRFKRVLLSHVMEGEVDKNGRLLISNTLRKVIGLEKQIMLVGSLNKFEIWDEAVWQAQIDDDLTQIAADDYELTDKLQDFSL
ncbi:division/cell wall cluster transcriptional repressor MraZ [Catenovulum sp. 2E275]|uniref:division/cell wall cluster transcriptional repressor MraZ n=1 Tax=Catenovulum sp. 2E275 TaxID=2980497 RepID=UPI0021D0C186|nr:division/cell wall cluster transcriptional repressor MraZ [Catenovulum sp. 2E275]MCU4674221.1 division/cell wall cluster transcriptional repressor MraZ [Catenovulum sp. 2E275]